MASCTDNIATPGYSPQPYPWQSPPFSTSPPPSNPATHPTPVPSPLLLPSPIPVISSSADELVKNYGWGEHYVMRWPNGTVDVYDTTGYHGLEEVLNQWNSAIGGPTVFQLSNNPSSPIRVSWDYALGLYEACGYTQVLVENNSFTLTQSSIKIFPFNSLCPLSSTFLHEFGHVVGFGGHTNDGSVMDPYNVGNVGINETIRTMLHRLYQLPVGTYIP